MNMSTEESVFALISSRLLHHFAVPISIDHEHVLPTANAICSSVILRSLGYLEALTTEMQRRVGGPEDKKPIINLGQESVHARRGYFVCKCSIRDGLNAVLRGLLTVYF